MHQLLDQSSIVSIKYLPARPPLYDDFPVEVHPYIVDGLKKSGIHRTYTPERRRQLEEQLFTGQLAGVISTNALELGIDIGDLDVCVLCGFPGSIAYTWQQSGRVGRSKQKSLVVLVASDDPLDRYMVHHSEFFFSQPSEKAIVNPHRLQFMVDHLPLAASELPLRKEDLTFWDQESYYNAVQFLRTTGRLRQDPNLRVRAYRSMGEPTKVGLRGEQKRFLLKLTDGRIIEQTTYQDDLGSYYEVVDSAGRIYIYDDYQGGVGLAESSLDVLKDVLQRCLDMVAECSCYIGCPSCIHIPQCKQHNEDLDKEGSILLLASLLNQSIKKLHRPKLAKQTVPTPDGSGNLRIQAREYERQQKILRQQAEAILPEYPRVLALFNEESIPIEAKGLMAKEKLLLSLLMVFQKQHNQGSVSHELIGQAADLLNIERQFFALRLEALVSRSLVYGSKEQGYTLSSTIFQWFASHLF
ncbi:helicase domain protein [Desulforamulus reducens MI-1]|uniref:Helicase domain protein n=1 Tax=Desulforamulus reducens (strain ATCC BAA-1160 / DSM 100696 / MI-1) TaxID=349161 RepID=A4J841_DESRM|nr:Zn-binding domain-containing protein [Desulforamulus reducens]ABO51244.1 helicase domain protein [Desulforamulus reducens MI-1]